MSSFAILSRYATGGSAKVTGEKYGSGQKPQFLPPTTDPACDLGASYPVSEFKFS